MLHLFGRLFPRRYCTDVELCGTTSWEEKEVRRSWQRWWWWCRTGRRQGGIDRNTRTPIYWNLLCAVAHEKRKVSICFQTYDSLTQSWVLGDRKWWYYVISHQLLMLLYFQENCNLIVSGEYSDATKRSMSLLNEKELSFELLEVSGEIICLIPWLGSRICYGSIVTNQYMLI